MLDSLLLRAAASWNRNASVSSRVGLHCTLRDEQRTNSVGKLDGVEFVAIGSLMAELTVCVQIVKGHCVGETKKAENRGVASGVWQPCRGNSAVTVP